MHVVAGLAREIASIRESYTIACRGGQTSDIVLIPGDDKLLTRRHRKSNVIGFPLSDVILD